MKKLTLLVIALFVCFSSVGFTAYKQEPASDRLYRIEKLGEAMPLSSDNTEFPDALIVDKKAFADNTKDTLQFYMDQGTVLFFSDSSYLYEDIWKKFDRYDRIAVGSTSNIGHLGFYMFNNGIENVLVKVSYGYMGEKNSVSSFSSAGKIDEEKVTVDILDKFNKFFKERTIDDSVKNQKQTLSNQSTSFFTSNYDDNYLYEVNTSAYVCSYTIYTQAYDVARIYQNNCRKDIWDVVSTVTVDANSGWYVRDYEVQMHTNITDHQMLLASYLNSNTSNTVSLSGGIGFQGSTITGSVEAGTSYTYNSNSQNIVNDLPAGNIKKWKVDPVVNTFNASWVVQPSVRFMNNNHDNQYNPYSGCFTRVNEFYITDGGWWIFARTLYLLPEYRKEVGMWWGRYGGFIPVSNIG